MRASMYSLSIPVFRKYLSSLSTILDKAAAHAQERKIEPAALLEARLYPDMLTFTRQIQLASDFAKGAAARLADEAPPKFDDVEVGFEELKGRIARTIAMYGPRLDRYSGVSGLVGSHGRSHGAFLTRISRHGRASLSRTGRSSTGFSSR